MAGWPAPNAPRRGTRRRRRATCRRGHRPTRPRSPTTGAHPSGARRGWAGRGRPSPSPWAGAGGPLPLRHRPVLARPWWCPRWAAGRRTASPWRAARREELRVHPPGEVPETRPLAAARWLAAPSPEARWTAAGWAAARAAGARWPAARAVAAGWPAARAVAAGWPVARRRPEDRAPALARTRAPAAARRGLPLPGPRAQPARQLPPGARRRPRPGPSAQRAQRRRRRRRPPRPRDR